MDQQLYDRDKAGYTDAHRILSLGVLGKMRLRWATAVVLTLLAVLAVNFALHSPGKVTVTAVGDIMLERGLLEHIKQNGPEYPFEHVKGMLSGDFVIGNLEGPVSNEGFPLPKMFTFRFSPDVLRSLKGAGFNILGLANNHSMDYGRKALLDTIEFIKLNAMHPLGAADRAADAAQPLYLEKNGIKAAFLAFSVFPYEGIYYDEDRPGIALARDSAGVSERVNAAAARADVMVVSFHWGKEFADYPSKLQIDMAHTAIDAGADLVIGHHPHVLQGIEKYKHGVVLYSLGNFVFDQANPRCRETAIARITLDANGVYSLEIIPLYITDGQPRLPDKEKAEDICRRVLRMSRNLGFEGMTADERGMIKIRL
jgi:poly-gamma-glutamate synthesis protein (capsule biosynthesis protein)